MDEKQECSSKKILIVEDEKPVRSALQNKFSFVGFKTVEAKNGKEGLELMQKEKPDLALIDVRMPVMGGIEMIRKFKEIERIKDTLFVVLTNDSTSETLADVMAVGGNHYFVKSDTPIEAIVDRVKMMLNC
ncbi:hypothetical protein COY62_02010 [bacterium (Candidatus Howlettbacteria) CG_4_10_14_0_8_um_filter_40_9]|nr:MAG: hypothetical protein COY62_02010 [bacterium (Candidatus Howlettbacteria) CG_4_10_14_0_8_um_filter_40_9]